MRSDGDVLFRILEEIDFRSGVNFPQVDAAVSRVLDQEAEQTCDPFWIMIGVLLIGQLSFFVLQSVGAFSAPMVFLAEVLLLCILATVYRPLRRQAEEQEALRREILFTLNRHSVTAEHRRRDREAEDTQSIAIKAHSQRRQELDRAAELEFYEDPEVKILP